MALIWKVCYVTLVKPQYRAQSALYGSWLHACPLICPRLTSLHIRPGLDCLSASRSILCRSSCYPGYQRHARPSSLACKREILTSEYWGYQTFIDWYKGKLDFLDPKTEMFMTEGNLLSERSFISSQKIFVMNFISNKQLIAIWLQQQNNTW